MTDRETGTSGTNWPGSPPFLLSLQPPDLIQPGLPHQQGKAARRAARSSRERERVKAAAIKNERRQERQADSETKWHLPWKHVSASVMPVCSSCGPSAHHPGKWWGHHP